VLRLALLFDPSLSDEHLLVRERLARTENFKPDADRAWLCYRLAADLGSAWAATVLCSLYFEAGVHQGCHDADAMFPLAFAMAGKAASGGAVEAFGKGGGKQGGAHPDMARGRGVVAPYPLYVLGWILQNGTGRGGADPRNVKRHPGHALQCFEYFQQVHPAVHPASGRIEPGGGDGAGLPAAERGWLQTAGRSVSQLKLELESVFRPHQTPEQKAAEEEEEAEAKRQKAMPKFGNAGRLFAAKLAAQQAGQRAEERREREAQKAAPKLKHASMALTKVKRQHARMKLLGKD
jgi:hypothetical protein